MQSSGQTSSALLVDVEFRGFSINLDKVTIDSLLRDGLFSPAFTLALQLSGESTYKNTEVDVIGGVQTTRSQSEESSRNVSAGGISAAILGSVAIVAAGTFYFFQTRKTNNKNKAFVRENQSAFNNLPAGSPNQSVLSPASSFSFDAASNLMSRMTRIVTSFSPRSSNFDEDATKSAEMTNSESSQSSKNAETSPINISAEDNMIEEGNEEESDEDDDEQDNGVHPYTGIIPPMIVIDRIDSDPDVYIEDAAPQPKKVRTIVPSMRLAASSDLIAALNDRSKPFDPDTFSSFIESNTTIGEDVDEIVGSASGDKLQIKGGGSSFNLFSSGDDDENDENSQSSNAECSDEVFDRLRNGAPTESDDTPQGTGMARLDLRSRHPFNIPLMARPPRVPSEGSAKNSPRSANTSPVISREKSTSDGYHSDDTAAKERASKRDVPSFLHSLWAKSPHNRNYPSAPKSDTSGESSFKRWASHRRSSSKGSYGTLGSLEEEGALLTFHAPKGQLGLVIECSTESSPIIAKVKDYSPLLDQVLPGDKIVMIDTTPTDKMGMSDVMSLLEGRSNRATSVRLKVFRAGAGGTDSSLANQVRSPTVSHLSFDGTGSLGTMSDHESPIHFAHKTTSLLGLPFPTASSGMKRSHSDADIYRNKESKE